MALSLPEAAKLSTEVLKKGIIETIIKDSPILQELPFIPIVGNSLAYNQEETLPGVGWYHVGEVWAESTPTFRHLTAALKILGGDADIDNFLKATRSNIQDLEAAIIESKTKAVRHEFENAFINGDITVDADQFDGLHKIVSGTPWTASTAYAVGDRVVPEFGEENGFVYVCTVAGTSDTPTNPVWPTVEGGTIAESTGVTWVARYAGHTTCGTGAAGTLTPGSLSLTKIDELIDLVRGGKPDMLLMSRRSRRWIAALSRAAGQNLTVGQGKLGQRVEEYGGIPIAISDWVKDNHAVTHGGAASDCGEIYAFQMGEDSVCGVSNGDMIQVEKIGALETKDANRTRIKFYVSLAVFSTIKAAMLSGFNTT